MTADLSVLLDQLKEKAGKATRGPWERCVHLNENDLLRAHVEEECPCGYRGGVWSGDGEYVVLEMGAAPESEETRTLAMPEAPREQQLADAAFIAAAHPQVVSALAEVAEAAEKRQRGGQEKARIGGLSGPGVMAEFGGLAAMQRAYDAAKEHAAHAPQAETNALARLHRVLAGEETTE